MQIKQWVLKKLIKALAPVDSSRGWIPILQEGYLGAFQADDPVTLSDALAHPIVFACVTQIASDVGKLRLRLMADNNGIRTEIDRPAYTPVLRKPNQFQTRQKFIEHWLISKLTHGNTYVLKVRDNRGVVIAMYILDPTRVEPLVADDGSVFYRAQKDVLSRVQENSITIPAREIIHDTMEALFHPLVGVPPLYAANLAVTQGLAMQRNSASFFQNNSQPGGVLSAPGHIRQETASRITAQWKENYSGSNSGSVAVLGDGLKFEPMATTAKDATLIEQLGWTDEKICSVYKVPPYKVHVGEIPTYQQTETLDRMYYSSCLQRLTESIENLLDEGLSLPRKYNTEFNLDDLMKMDFSLKMSTAVEGIKGGVFTHNEGRRRFNLPPKEGGDVIYSQQQYFDIAALHERDQNKPFANPVEPTEPTPDPEPDQTDKALYLLFKKQLISGHGILFCWDNMVTMQILSGPTFLAGVVVAF